MNLHELLVACDSELSAMAHGRPPSDKQALKELSLACRKHYEANGEGRNARPSAQGQVAPGQFFPTPWRVEYDRRCPEWHEQSCPYIVDADGATVVSMPQHVGHPGQYDELADQTAQRIVLAVNQGASQ